MKILQNQNNEGFFIHFPKIWLHFNNKTPTDIEEILLRTKIILSSNNPCIYSITPKNITDKVTIIKDLCRFLQPDLVYYIRFEEKLGHTQLNSERISMHAMHDLIPNVGSTILGKKLLNRSSSRFSVLTTKLLGK